MWYKRGMQKQAYEHLEDAIGNLVWAEDNLSTAAGHGGRKLAEEIRPLYEKACRLKVEVDQLLPRSFPEGEPDDDEVDDE